MTSRDDTIGQLAQRIYQLSQPARDRNVLPVWTVYNKPKDFPHCFVARRFESGPGGTSVATPDVIISPDLEILREGMERCGLVCMMRDEADDSVIIETWM